MLLNSETSNDLEQVSTAITLRQGDFFELWAQQLARFKSLKMPDFERLSKIRCMKP